MTVITKKVNGPKSRWENFPLTLDQTINKAEKILQINHIRKLSPTSVKVTLRQIQEGRKLNTLAECLKMEYRYKTFVKKI